MQELALVIENPVEGQWLKHIDWNKAEFEKAIDAAVKDYQDVAYGEDQIKQAKDDRAALNKIKKAIEDRRKAVKKVVNAPYDQFEKEVKEVTQKLDAAVTQIDTQVKAYESRQRDEKRAQILDYFRGELVKANQGDIEAEKLCEASWLNASFSMAQVKKAIEAKVENLKNGFAFCNNFPDDERVIALNEFGKKYDLGDTLAAVNEFKSTKAAVEAQKARESAQSKAEELIERLDGQLQGKNEKREERANQGDTEGTEQSDALQSAAEKPVEPEAKEDVVSTKMGIVFNGEMLCRIMDLMRTNDVACRGSMNVQLVGTKRDLLAFIEGLKESGIKYGKV